MLHLEHVTVRYGDLVAVDDVSLAAADGEVVALVGPSGCGKSTLLRAVAGLEPLAAGRILLDGHDLAARRPDQRDVGLAFQDGALFPHRTVAENVAFGPRMRGWDPPAIRTRVTEVLRLVDLPGYEGRQVTELSGGEAQRVSLARAVASRPRLLMLDEPLGALDRALRDRLVAELPRLFADLDATVVHVTHDQDEALTLADRVAVMRAGRFQQVGTPDQLWRSPADAEVARFLGLDQLLPGRVTRDGQVETVLGPLRVSADGVATGPDGAVTVLLLPDAVDLADGDPAEPDLDGDRSDRVTAPGTVTGRRFAGDHLVVTVATTAGPAVTVPVRGGGAPHVGDAVTVTIDPSAVRVLPPDPPPRPAS